MIEDGNADRPALVATVEAQPRAPRGDSLRRLATWRDLYRRGAPEEQRLAALESSDPHEVTEDR